MHRRLAVIAAGLIFVAGCAGSEAAEFVTCENGIVVYADVDCRVVSVDESNLSAEVQAEIAALRSEADVNPSKALGNGQTIMRLLSAAPFSVCDALQNSPDGEFLTTDTIAPIAAELAGSTCPSAELLAR